MKQLLLCLILFTNLEAVAQEPSRKAWMGANGSFSQHGFTIDTILPGSTLAKMALRRDDTILKLNTITITDQITYNNIAGTIRAQDAIAITYKRGNKTSLVKGAGIMRPYDTSSIAEVIYDWINAGDCRLRSIVRKPKGKTNLPAVLLIPGYNCGSIENYNQGSYSKLIKAWLLAGFAVVTVEKSGLGDSYNCMPCSQADLATDIKTFDAGYEYMEQLPFVDKSNLFIWGHSMGGVIAPLIAEKHKPKGVIVFATVYRPWSEFLLEMHRVQLPLDGKSYAETEDYIRKIQKIYYEFFRLKKSPAELYQNPEYKDMVVSEMDYKDGGTNMWGRHWRFWQQIDSLDLARSWESVNAKVLSVFGDADYIACSAIEHDLIVAAVNSKHPGNAKNVHIPDVDHLIIQNKDRIEAHKHFSDLAYRNAHFHQGFANTVTNWMKSITAE